jgi:rhodanese-related sulfurtransferase
MRQRQHPNILLDLAGVLILAAVSMAGGLAVNLVRGGPLPLIYASPEQRLEAQLGELIKAPPFQLPQADSVDLAEFRPLVAGKGALILDARAEPYYREGHVPGALHLSREDFARDYTRLRSTLEHERDKPIVVYCSGGECHDSKMVASALLSLGFSDVRVFTGGWDAWTAAGQPVAR